MTFGGAPTVFRLRQANPTTNGLGALVGLAIIVYTLAGFGVYWLVTGSWTIGLGGHLSTIGGLVWLAPIALGFPTLLTIGDRGPFRALYYPRTTVTVGPDGVAWWTAKHGDGAIAWSSLGGVSSTRARYSTFERVFGRSGQEVVAFDGRFKVEGRGKSVTLPPVIVEARPGSFGPLDPRHPDRACIRIAGDGDDRTSQVQVASS